jgi:hypothetical protein
VTDKTLAFEEVAARKARNFPDVLDVLIAGEPERSLED